jgi:superfamily II DNA or RNA helicase
MVAGSIGCSLTSRQMNVIRAVLSSDMCVLIAPPGAGKTVMGCYAGPGELLHA